MAREHGVRSLNARLLGVHFGPIDTISLGGGLLVALTGAWAVIVLKDVGAPSGAGKSPLVEDALASSVPAGLGASPDLSQALADGAAHDGTSFGR